MRETGVTVIRTPLSSTSGGTTKLYTTPDADVAEMLPPALPMVALTARAISNTTRGNTGSEREFPRAAKAGKLMPDQWWSGDWA